MPRRLLCAVLFSLAAAAPVPVRAQAILFNRLAWEELDAIRTEANAVGYRLTFKLLDSRSWGAGEIDPVKAAMRDGGGLTWDGYGVYKLAGWRLTHEGERFSLVADLKAEKYPCISRAGAADRIVQALSPLEGMLVEDRFWATPEKKRMAANKLAQAWRSAMAAIRDLTNATSGQWQALDRDRSREYEARERQRVVLLGVEGSAGNEDRWGSSGGSTGTGTGGSRTQDLQRSMQESQVRGRSPMETVRDIIDPAGIQRIMNRGRVFP